MLTAVSSSPPSSDLAARSAMVAATVMIAQQTAAKATRDALFLSHFDVSSLPTMLIVAALTSIGAVVLVTRVVQRLGPTRLAPRAFAASSVVLLAIWALSAVSPGAAGVALYLHVAALGAVLISSFWSLVTERFDPRTAKRYMGRIAGGATLGGLIGGLFAERIAATVGAGWMLPSLAVMHVGCAWLVGRVGRGAAEASVAPGSALPSERRADSPVAILRRSSHLRNLASMLLLINVVATLLDYVFKARAVVAFGDGDALLRFFAVFYTGVGVATFGVQSLLSKRSLARLGLSGTVATLPGAVFVGGAGALLLPGIGSATAARGAESVLRSSLFRSGYELFYTPIPPADKRATKMIIDVGFDRAGDVLGSVLVLALLLLPAAASGPAMLAVAAAIAAFAVWFSRRLGVGYVASLERSLVERAVQLDVGDINDSTTRAAVMNTLGAHDLRDALAQLRAQGECRSSTEGSPSLVSRAALTLEFELPGRSKKRRPRVLEVPAGKAGPATVSDSGILASGDASAIRERLQDSTPLEPGALIGLIRLLAWDDVRADVIVRLGRLAPERTPELVEALLDPDQEFAVRRRLPVVLRHGDPALAAAGLVRGLKDRRFEVRYRCARVLAQLVDGEQVDTLDPAPVEAAILRELAVGRRIWDSRRLLDAGADESDPLLRDVLERRENRSLEHVFRLLALTGPGRPMRVAYQGLHTDDPTLRGTALEYLETALPETVQSALWPFLDADERAPREARPVGPAREALLASMESIWLNLEQLREGDE